MTATEPKPMGDVLSAIESRFERIKAHKEKNTQPQPNTAADEYNRDRLWKAAEVPSLHAKLADPEGAPWHATFGALRAKLGTGFIFALIGVRGSGKTQIGVELIREQSKRLKSSRFTTAMDIFLAIKSTYRKDANGDERQIVEEFCKPRLLVIDEIQERAESPWEDRILTHLINRRYNDEKDTLLIGNANKEQFASAMGASIVSRLNETGGILTCDWQSFRK